MDITQLNERYHALLKDAQTTLQAAVQSLGGSFYFIMDDDPRLEEIDDFSELELPLIGAYSYNYGDEGDYYVTALLLGKNGVEIYGVAACADSLEDTVQLDDIPIAAILYILDFLPESK